MANEVTLTPEGIIEIVTEGDQTAASVAVMAHQTQALLEAQASKGQPRLILDNIIKLGHTDIAARKAVADFAHKLDFKKCAMLGGGNMVMRIGTNLMLQAIGKGNIKYFEDRAAAIAWLLKV